MPDAGAEAVINQSAVDVLRRLPGVSDANYRPLDGETEYAQPVEVQRVLIAT